MLCSGQALWHQAAAAEVGLRPCTIILAMPGCLGPGTNFSVLCPPSCHACSALVALCCRPSTTTARASSSMAVGISSVASIDGGASNTLNNNFNAAVDLDTLFGGYSKIGELSLCELGHQKGVTAPVGGGLASARLTRTCVGSLNPPRLCSLRLLLTLLACTCRQHRVPPCHEAVPGHQDAHCQVGLGAGRPFWPVLPSCLLPLQGLPLVVERGPCSVGTGSVAVD